MKKLIVWGILLAGFIASNSGQAADLTWTNGDGLFSDAANWDTGTSPLAGDNTSFTNDSSYTVSFSANSPALVTNTFAGHNGTVTADVGTFTWTVTGRMRIGTGTSTATVYLAGGTLSVASGGFGQVRVADGTNAVGKLVITNGTLIADVINVGSGVNSSGTLVISGAGVVTNTADAGSFNVGGAGSTCRLVITNGGKLFLGGDARIGDNNTSNNLALISDPSSIWFNVGAIRLGSSGSKGNMLIVSNGAQLFTFNGGTLGNAASYNTGVVVGAGSALISSGGASLILGTSSSSSTNNDLTVYDGGYLSCNGTLSFNQGNPSFGNSFHMGGPGAMSTGFAVVVRNNSTGTTNGLMVVSNAYFTCSQINLQGGANSLSVLANGSVVFSNQYAISATTTNILNINTGVARVLIDGGTISAVSGSNVMGVVLGGSGTLSGNMLVITNGGKLLSELATIGSGSMAHTAIVTGAGSVWSNSTGVGFTNSLIIGSSTGGSNNYLAVLNGASLFNSGSFNIGNNPAANVNSVCFGGVGASSTVINSGSLNIGSSSGSYSNRLTVTNAVLNCGTMNVGVSGSTNNLLELKNGTIAVGFIRVRPTNTLLFTAGTLNTGGTTVDALANNGRPTVIGDGTSAAYLELAAGGTGFHDFNAGGLVITNSATLRGSGTLLGNVTVLGTWSPGFSVGSVITSNNLVFGSGAVVNYDLGTSSDSTEVNGNLALNGTLNVSAAAGFGAGTYTLFTYTGTLSGNGLTIGSTPDSGLDYFIDTNTAGQVKLDVGPPPAASFSGSPTSGAFPLAVTFTDSSTGVITNRFWSFGDGATSNTLATTVVHTYNVVGTNTVTLAVFGLNSSSTNTQANYIIVLNPPLLTVNPSTLNFGSLTVGLSNSLDFSVINTGDMTLTGSAASASPFSVTSGATYNVAPGQTQTVTVAFEPASAGTFTGAVTFVSDGGNFTNTVIGTGLTPGSIQVTPASQDFGNVTTGMTAFVSFIVTNTGGTSVSNGTAAVVGGAPFTIVSNANFSLTGFGVTNVVVQFAPLTEDAFTDKVAFASDNGGVATNTVIGTGTQFLVPVASFTATPTNGLTPLSVTFTDTSTGTITNRFWNFGDGTTTNTTVTSLSHTYSVNPPGDVNKDGKVTITDSLFINQALASLRTTNSATFLANYTVSLVAEGPGGSSTNTKASFIGLCVFPNGDVNTNGVVNSGDSLLINQVIATLRSYVVTKIVPNIGTTNVPTAVTIYGIGFNTNTVTGVTIGSPVNLTLSNVVAVSSVQITAIVPAGGGLGTGTVSVIATPSNSVTSFGRFISQ